jgi:hypothetical protein
VGRWSLIIESGDEASGEPVTCRNARSLLLR